MHRWKQKWIVLLLLAVFLFAAPAAFAAEIGSSSTAVSSETASAASSKEGSSSEMMSSEAGASSSSDPSGVSSAESQASSQTATSSTEEPLGLKSLVIFDGAGGDDLTANFSVNGYRITGTVPNSVASVSVQATANRGSCVVDYHQQGLSEGENPNYATITVSDGTQNAYYYISVTRKASNGGSIPSAPSAQSVVDWNADGVSDASTPSELDSWQATDNSSEEASSQAEASSKTSSTAIIEGSGEGGGWMLPTAVVLILLGVLGIVFVVCDILYTKGILKKWIVPRKGEKNGATHAAQKTEPEQTDASAQQPPVPTDSEDWDEFFRDK